MKHRNVTEKFGNHYLHCQIQAVSRLERLIMRSRKAKNKAQVLSIIEELDGITMDFLDSMQTWCGSSPEMQEIERLLACYYEVGEHAGHPAERMRRKKAERLSEEALKTKMHRGSRNNNMAMAGAGATGVFAGNDAVTNGIQTLFSEFMETVRSKMYEDLWEKILEFFNKLSEMLPLWMSQLDALGSPEISAIALVAPAAARAGYGFIKSRMDKAEEELHNDLKEDRIASALAIRDAILNNLKIHHATEVHFDVIKGDLYAVTTRNELPHDAAGDAVKKMDLHENAKNWVNVRSAWNGLVDKASPNYLTGQHEVVNIPELKQQIMMAMYECKTLRLKKSPILSDSERILTVGKDGIIKSQAIGNGGNEIVCEWASKKHKKLYGVLSQAIHTLDDISASEGAEYDVSHAGNGKVVFNEPVNVIRELMRLHEDRKIFASIKESMLPQLSGGSDMKNFII